MFGQDLPPGVDRVKIFAMSGNRGNPPCIWEGPASTPQSDVERAICKDRRVSDFLKRNKLIRQGTATIDLRLVFYSQNQKVDTVEVEGHAFLVSRMRRKPDEAAGGQQGLVDALISSHALVEKMVNFIVAGSADKDVVIGRLVGRGLKQTDEGAGATQIVQAAPMSTLDEIFDKLPKGLDMLNSLEDLKERRQARNRK